MDKVISSDKFKENNKQTLIEIMENIQQWPFIKKNDVNKK